jgi:aminoglycoside phosphotransferase (APT) family kinase protein
LAAFLRRLHSHEVLAAVGDDLPVDPNRRIDMTVRVPKTREVLARIEELGIWTAPPETAQLLAEAERLRASPRLAVCHGDLHVRHVLIDAGAVAGVIDWNDMCRADPALDLSLLWSAVPLELHDAFVAGYGELSADQVVRARVISLCLCAIMAEQARLEGNAALEAALVGGLDRAATD